MASLRVVPTIDGLRLREKPIDGKPVGQVNTDDTLLSLESAAETHRKLGQTEIWLHVRTEAGLEGYAAAWFLTAHAQDTQRDAVPVPDPADDTPLLRYAKAVQDGLRLRRAPVDGEAFASVNSTELLELLDEADAARLGVEGEWVQVRRLRTGDTGYAAAWFLVAAQAPALRRVRGETHKMGVNLDRFHPLGTPDPARLAGLGWVRFGYNVSAGTGSTDIRAAYEHYAPLAERYARAGIKVLFAFSHQTYGEGRNEFWPWANMSDDKWQRLTERFAEMVGKIAAQYAGQDLVHCWQVWNEQDAPIGAVASVPMAAHNYAHLFAESLRAIRAADPEVVVISGGHTRGPGPGAQYARDTVAALPADALPDGIAFHPYGRGTQPNGRYANWGHIEDSLAAYGAVLPGRPLWITEWGVLDKAGDPPQEIADYAVRVIDYINTKHPGRVAAAIWYAWAMGMHNGYGLVDANDRPIPPLYDTYRDLG